MQWVLWWLHQFISTLFQSEMELLEFTPRSRETSTSFPYPRYLSNSRPFVFSISFPVTKTARIIKETTGERKNGKQRKQGGRRESSWWMPPFPVIWRIDDRWRRGIRGNHPTSDDRTTWKQIQFIDISKRITIMTVMTTMVIVIPIAITITITDLLKQLLVFPTGMLSFCVYHK